MRTIKFRGKRKDNRGWVFGDLNQNDIHHGNSILTNGVINNAVDPETVGQFTGLTDKNGREIYENDVLEYDTGKRYVVVYSTEGLDSNANEFYIGAFMLKDDRNFHELICSVTRPYRYAEIIGNIHDNPNQ